MSDDVRNGERGWTLAAYIAHNEALREAEARFYAERDRRYADHDQSNAEALKAALAAVEKASDKTEQALKEYKQGANEWRDTVKDLVANMPSLRDFKALEEKIALLREVQATEAGRDKGISLSWAVLVGVVALLGALWAFTDRAEAPTVQPQVIMVPAQPGTLIPSQQQQTAPK